MLTRKRLTLSSVACTCLISLASAAPAPVGTFSVKGVESGLSYTGEVSIERDGSALVMTSSLEENARPLARAEQGKGRRVWLFDFPAVDRQGIVGRLAVQAGPGGAQATVGAKRMKLRAGPSLAAASVGRIHEGEQLQVIERSGAWRRLRHTDGRSGWAHGAFLILSGSSAAAALEVAPASPNTYTARLWRNGQVEAQERWAAPRGTLAQEIDAIVAASSAQLSIRFEDEASHEVVYEHDSHRSLVPASNMKVLTTSAALALLGSGFEYRTRAVVRGVVKDGVLHGDLIVIGSGDPTISKRFQRSKPLLQALVDAVWQAGIHSIRGDLVADDRAFDSELRHPDWSAGDRRRWYGAGVSALNLAENCSGRRKPVANPSRFFLTTLRTQLGDQGIAIEGALRRAAPTEDVSTAKQVWVSHAPLRRVLRVILKNSHNLYAECLLKTLGRRSAEQGTWTNGALAIETQARSAGVPADELRVVDGSGLSRNNRLSAYALVRVLQTVADAPYAKLFRSCLASPGRAGTLRRRLKDLAGSTVVYAKTGTLTGVASLSGYMELRGRRLTFAIVANGPGENKKTIDAVVRAMADRLDSTSRGVN